VTDLASAVNEANRRRRCGAGSSCWEPSRRGGRGGIPRARTVLHRGAAAHPPARRRRALARLTGLIVVDGFAWPICRGTEGKARRWRQLLSTATRGRARTPLAVLNIGGRRQCPYIDGERRSPSIRTRQRSLIEIGWGRQHAHDCTRAAGWPPPAGTHAARREAGNLLDYDYLRARGPNRRSQSVSPERSRAFVGRRRRQPSPHFTAQSVRTVALHLLPAPPRRWLVTGGGRHNRPCGEVRQFPADEQRGTPRLSVSARPEEAGGGAEGWEKHSGRSRGGRDVRDGVRRIRDKHGDAGAGTKRFFRSRPAPLTRQKPFRRTGRRAAERPAKLLEQRLSRW